MTDSNGKVRRLKVLMLAPSLRDASARLRLSGYEAALAGLGIDALAAEIPRGAFHRFRVFRSLGEYDVVILHRRLLGAIGFKMVRNNARKLVFDFDDAVMFRDSFHGKAVSWKRARRFARTVRGADGVIAGSRHLAEKAAEYGAICPITLIPTPVDPATFEPAPGGGAKLGWIGQKSTLPYLDDVLSAIGDAARSTPGLSLTVISDSFPDASGIDLRKIAWSEKDEAARLSEIDIGLMPLRDDPWSRGKCGYKILQYFAASKPVIASPVGVNVDLVEHGVNGFLASDRSAWVDAILKLSTNLPLQISMGRAGRMKVEKGGFDLRTCASKLAVFLREIASER